MDRNLNAVSIFDKLAKAYEEKFMNVDAYGNSLDFFCASLVPQTPRILDVACGPGNIAAYIMQLLPECEFLGIDLAPKMIELAKKNVSRAHFAVNDARKINELQGDFDGIIVGFLFPYLNEMEVKEFIQTAHDKLTLGGILYISTMEHDYSKSGLRKSSTGDEIFMHYYLSQDISHYLLENNFQILFDSKVPIEYSGEHLPQNDLILIARK